MSFKDGLTNSMSEIKRGMISSAKISIELQDPDTDNHDDRTEYTLDRRDLIG